MLKNSKKKFKKNEKKFLYSNKKYILGLMTSKSQITLRFSHTYSVKMTQIFNLSDTFTKIEVLL